jgi:hypothetical protein
MQASAFGAAPVVWEVTATVNPSPLAAHIPTGLAPIRQPRSEPLSAFTRAKAEPAAAARGAAGATGTYSSYASVDGSCVDGPPITYSMAGSHASMALKALCHAFFRQGGGGSGGRKQRCGEDRGCRAAGRRPAACCGALQVLVALCPVNLHGGSRLLVLGRICREQPQMSVTCCRRTLQKVSNQVEPACAGGLRGRVAAAPATGRHQCTSMISSGSKQAEAPLERQRCQCGRTAPTALGEDTAASHRIGPLSKVQQNSAATRDTQGAPISPQPARYMHDGYHSPCCALLHINCTASCSDRTKTADCATISVMAGAAGKGMQAA